MGTVAISVLTTLIIVAIFFYVAPSEASDQWNVCRNVGNGACSLQPSDMNPQLGKVLGTFASKKEGCDEASALHTSDSADTTKCFDYTINTRDICGKAG
jgi:hypothetical protein